LPESRSLANPDSDKKLMVVLNNVLINK